MRFLKTTLALLPILAILAAACSNPLDSNQGGGKIPASTTIGNTEALPETPTSESSADRQSAVCDDPFGSNPPAFQTAGWNTNFCLHSIPYDEIFSGGPPRDGIPPIDNPRFESVSSADAWIEDLEPVILLDHLGEARAYPLQILTWHEIVNDQIGDDPVVVTFCPLCNTALAFHRPTIEGEILTFGTSGNLRFSDLVMWDRQTESWWQQFNGEAIVGDLTGTRLEPLAAAIVSWADFKDNHPDGKVLSIETGFNRSYGRNPYPGYDNVNNLPFAFRGIQDDELPPMERVVGVLLESGEAAAFNRELIQEERVLNETINDNPLVIFWKAGTTSALDSSSIPDSRDIGTSAVFKRVLDGQTLTFSANTDGTFTDQETGSTWNILGSALDGPLVGKQLEPLPHHDTFWFAWAAFVPDGDLTQ